MISIRKQKCIVSRKRRGGGGCDSGEGGEGMVTCGTAIGRFVTGSMYEDRGLSTSGDDDLRGTTAAAVFALIFGGACSVGSRGDTDRVVSLDNGDPARRVGASVLATTSTEVGLGDLDADLRPTSPRNLPE